jgi:hypothetical protein
MTTLESLLGSLTGPGTYITVPKDSVEPLDSNWIPAWFSVAPPGTIASYRYGHYNAYESATEYTVHYDKYAPQIDPMLHLLFDAHFIAPVCVIAIAASLYYVTMSKK